MPPHQNPRRRRRRRPNKNRSNNPVPGPTNQKQKRSDEENPRRVAAGKRPVINGDDEAHVAVVDWARSADEEFEGADEGDVEEEAEEEGDEEEGGGGEGEEGDARSGNRGGRRRTISQRVLRIGGGGTERSWRRRGRPAFEDD
ncbi:uncharacterized protein A4U43_C04F35410 [Asparagus officinalis]|uniref:Uncharacterized protein n=1 Tax=Asparagus officinalis TaxID=4686 RepID=A0A5P1F6I9_ASPOF|nr:uncharacterized protein A4U43_C04F35410 [Asparagus officinalis]